MNVDELREAWPALSAEERFEAFQLLPRDDAEEFFSSQTTRSQAAILECFPEKQRRAWARLFPRRSRRRDPGEAARGARAMLDL
jgi:magnesium transporter